jgi:glycine/D-amino acid oxidase-like deaminating enzyme
LKDGSGSAKIEPAGSLDVKKFLSVSKQYFKSIDSFLDQEFDYNQLNPQKGIYKDMCAEKIIFCEGFRVLENPFFKFLPLRPTKGEVITIRIPSLKRLDYILSAGIYIVCLRDYEYIVGATYTHQHMDDLVSEQGINHLVSSLNKLLDVEFELIEAKAGVRPTVFDRKPLLGLHPNLTKLAVFNGLGTRGILIAPLLSAHLSTNLTQSTNSCLALDNERIKSFY